jgi:hypothetical protein
MEYTEFAGWPVQAGIRTSGNKPMLGLILSTGNR